MRRLVLGLVLGLVAGGLVAAAIVLGLRTTEFAGTGGAILAYAAGALTGVLTGLVAGKPIWAADAKIEAGLKAVFGALLGAGMIFALRQWGGALGELDLRFMGAGKAHVGDLPAVSLPLLAVLLGGFFEVDNASGGAEAKTLAAPQNRKRIAPQTTNGRSTARAVGSDERNGEAAEIASKSAKR